MVKFTRLTHIPTREELVKNHPPTTSLLILPGKEEDAYMPPHRLIHQGERETTLGKAMRPLPVKRKDENVYDYDLHCVGISVVGNDGLDFNPIDCDKSFSIVYYLIGEGVYQEVVVPPIDPTLPLQAKIYIEKKYKELSDFLSSLAVGKLSTRDRENYLRGQARQKEQL